MLSPPPDSAVRNGELAGADLHSLTDRTAMGLPERFVDRLDPVLVASHTGDLAGAGADRLVGFLEDPDGPPERRWAAGTLLALRGDPRLEGDLPEMVGVPAVTTRIGLDPGDVADVLDRWRDVGVREDWLRKECPVHDVDLAAYRIMRRPVTNVEYRRFLLATAHPATPTSWRFGSYAPERANHPVWTVTAGQAQAYAAWLSARTGRTLRLPTEAEWEHAAHGGTARTFPWGEHWEPWRVNTVEQGPLDSTPVGMYPLGRSPLGLDDLAGNVEELVADDYAPYPGGPTVVDDLSDRAGGSYRVTRGGAFTRFGDLARCRRRHGWFGRDIYPVGFRLVEVVG